ncbi:MAG TPA: SGNH/GDSL hydrolase family protein [Chitinophagaceae bacterium]
MTRHTCSWIALGDSYTIGEAVPLHESFPYQALQLLRKRGFHFHAPEIVAKTGWTTFELADHMLHTTFNDQYDFVTLLIGVNNQYRGLPLDDFKSDFEFLLKKAIRFTAGNAKRVLVISIPDWGTTPFALGREIKKIASEIDCFNQAKKEISDRYNVRFIDITSKQRADGSDIAFVTTDKLHPSAKEYAKWAEGVAEHFVKQLSD